jgi:itaconate CoA-transferase
VDQPRQHSDLMILLARTTPLAEVKKKSEGMSIFIVDLREAIGKGLTCGRSQHGQPRDQRAVLREPGDPGREPDRRGGQGFKYILDGLNAERTLIAAECIGDGYWFIDRVSKYVKERMVFGRPIGQNQGVQFPIAEAYIEVEAANLMRWKACDLFDAHLPCGAEANMAKYLAAKASWEAANACLQFHGGFGFACEYDVERKFRETRLYQVAPISTNLILSYVAEHVLGLPRSFCITVVTLEHAIAAPFCTRQLADQGARVIKIERPGVGDFARAYDTRVNGLCSHFVWTNRSKESLSLDLKADAAGEILDKLLAGADVLVQNLAPGAAARMGLSYDVLSAKYPKLIVCDISGYGNDDDNPGPYRDKKAYDLLIQSESGFVSITGTPDEPSKAGCSIADIAAGMYAYTNILTALLQRGRTGRGRHIDVSMLEAMTEWMTFPLYYAYDGAAPPPRAGAAHATIYPYGPFATGDGKTVMLGLQNEREWVNFCAQVLQQPALATDARFNANAKRTAARSELKALIEQAFASPDGGAGGGPARRGRHRQRPGQRHGRPVGASATAGASALDRGGRRPPARCRRCCRRAAPRPAWTPCRPGPAHAQRAGWIGLHAPNRSTRWLRRGAV